MGRPTKIACVGGRREVLSMATETESVWAPNQLIHPAERLIGSIGQLLAQAIAFSSHVPR